MGPFFTKFKQNKQSHMVIPITNDPVPQVPLKESNAPLPTPLESHLIPIEHDKNVSTKKVSEWPPFIQDMSIDDDFNATLEADLQESLNKAMNQVLLDTDTSMNTLIQEYKNKICKLEKENGELESTRDNLRQELLETRKLSMFESSFMDENDSNTLKDSNTLISELKQEILELKSQNQKIQDESVKKIAKFKLKCQKLKADSSAKLYELQQQLQETMEIVKHTQQPPPLIFESSLPSPLLLQIQELKLQLESKNQLILDLSLQLQDSKKESFQVAKAAE